MVDVDDELLHMIEPRSVPIAFIIRAYKSKRGQRGFVTTPDQLMPFYSGGPGYTRLQCGDAAAGLDKHCAGRTGV